MTLSNLKNESVSDKEVFNDFFLSDSKGIKCVAVKDFDKMNQLFLTNEKIKELYICNDRDYYICLNDLKTWQRNNDSVIALNGFFVDIDFKTVGMDQKTCLFMLNSLLSENNIFEPSLIFSSGTGLYLLWKIEKVYCNSPKILKLWQQIQHDLIEKLACLGADSSVSAPSNLIRLPGTYNQKNGSKTALIDFSGLEYELSDFREEVSTYSPKKAKKVLFKSIYNLNVSRVHDIEKLFELRNYDCDGLRNEMLFIYRNFLNLAEDKNAHEKVVDMNNKLTNPLSKRELSYLNNNRKNYLFTNETIINHLQIDSFEMQFLKTVMNVNEKRRRKSIRNKMSYEPKKQANQLDKEKRNSLVKQLFAEGYTIQKIAKKMNLHRNTVSNILKK